MIEYLEIWEDCLIIAFAHTITKVFQNPIKYELISSPINEIAPSLIKFIMKIITTNEKLTKNDYVEALNTITEYFSTGKRLKNDQDISDFVVNLGGFGKSALSKRFCVYFCTCLFQVAEMFK